MVEVANTVDSELLKLVDHTVGKSHGYFLRNQYPNGYWWGELESNSTMEAEYLLLTHFLGVADRERWHKLVNHILSRQREDGTWAIYYGAPGDLSTTVECYFALKLAGLSVDDPRMRRAREFILSRGGVPRVRVFTKIWLALFGQWDWKGTPAMPPEMMFLPSWFSLNIYDFSSWARSTLVPMLIILTKHPTCPVPELAGIDELYPAPRHTMDVSLARPKHILGWRGFFHAADKAVRLYERVPWKPLRKCALRKVERWIVGHQEADGSWGGIQPPWVYSLIALKTLGYPADHPVIAQGLRGFEDFAIEEGNTWRVQACVSPLWDTCLAMIGLLDTGMPREHPALQKAARWLLKEQILTGGDWQVKNSRTAPGGWAFEFHNDIYPDVDDTAEIIMALDRVDLPSGEKQTAMDRAVGWTLSMQSKNGGWASFDRDNTRRLTTKLPFCDFGEMIDPPTVDVTAHVVEMLGKMGYTKDKPPIRRALEFIKREQEPEGCWFGRWGVNYIYGTGAVLPALEAVGEDMGQDYVRRAVNWLIAHQNPDGGWGESCASYANPSNKGQGPSTASQTAWALIALLAAGEVQHPSVSKGIEYLVRTQRGDGSWDEPFYTGAGFPGYGIGNRLDAASRDESAVLTAELPSGFMINYHLYRNYFPLWALGRYRSMVKGGHKYK